MRQLLIWAMARSIGDRHTQLYLSTANYRNNLVRLGWSEADVEPPGSDRLFDAVIAWGGIERVRERADALFAAGSDQVVLNLVTADPAIPYLSELEQLSVLTR